MKTSGAEFKRFINDESYWPKVETYYEDELITVDGCDVPEFEFNPETVPDEAVVTIEGGIVFSEAWDHESAPGFDAYFRKWKRLQANTTMVIEFPKDKLASVKEALKAAGIKEVKS